MSDLPSGISVSSLGDSPALAKEINDLGRRFAEEMEIKYSSVTAWEVDKSESGYTEFILCINSDIHDRLFLFGYDDGWSVFPVVDSVGKAHFKSMLGGKYNVIKSVCGGGSV